MSYLDESERKLVRNHMAYSFFLCILYILFSVVYEDSAYTNRVTSLVVSVLEVVFFIVNIILYITKKPKTLFGMNFEWDYCTKFELYILLCVTSSLYAFPGMNIVVFIGVALMYSIYNLFSLIYWIRYRKHLDLEF